MTGRPKRQALPARKARLGRLPLAKPSHAPTPLTSTRTIPQPDASFDTHFVCQKRAWEPCCSTRHAHRQIAPGGQPAGFGLPRRNAASAFELASRDLKCPPLAPPMHGMYGKGNSTQSSLCVSLEKMKSMSCLKMRRNATSPSSRPVWRRLRKS
jgi:hypothetical protein